MVKGAPPRGTWRARCLRGALTARQPPGAWRGRRATPGRHTRARLRTSALPRSAPPAARALRCHVILTPKIFSRCARRSRAQRRDPTAPPKKPLRGAAQRRPACLARLTQTTSSTPSSGARGAPPRSGPLTP